MTAQELRIELKSKINESLSIDVPISISETSFGTSMYIQKLGYGKIRISNHSVTNYNRIFEEIHYSINTILENIDSLLLDVEMIYFPERFELVRYENNYVHYTHNIYTSIEDFNSKTQNSTILGTRFFTNKAGVEKVEIEFSYPKTEIRTKKIRK